MTDITKLLEQTAKLCSLNKQIEKIQPQVLQATRKFVHEQDGFEYWWSNETNVSIYDNLKKVAEETIDYIEQHISSNLPHIFSAESLGIPATITTEDYTHHITTEIFPEINARIQEIDIHLEQELQRVREELTRKPNK